MTIGMFRAKAKRLKIGKFRLLKAGELMEGHDLEVGQVYMTHVGEIWIGLPVGKSDTILRLEFEDKC